MRKVTIKQTNPPKKRQVSLRPLKRGEIKKLAKFGYTYLGCHPKLDTAQDAVDKALDMVLTPDDQKFLDECDNKQVKDLWSELLKETYGDPEEAKNLKTTTDGMSTEKE